jgi:hypothetical protein
VTTPKKKRPGRVSVEERAEIFLREFLGTRKAVALGTSTYQDSKFLSMLSELLSLTEQHRGNAMDVRQIRIVEEKPQGRK